jgi:UDP-N-acetylglucosamine transferase subunit ALG13
VIFVTVGTNEAPFDRLLRGVEPLAARDELIVQYGSGTYRPAGSRCVDFLAFDEVVAHVVEASVVITHGGVGSVAVALANGKIPVVVPRRRAFGEAVDDHQFVFARHLAATGIVTLVDDPAMLTELEPLAPSPFRVTQRPSRLVAELEAYLAESLGPIGRGRPS